MTGFDLPRLSDIRSEAEQTGPAPFEGAITPPLMELPELTHVNMQVQELEPMMRGLLGDDGFEQGLALKRREAMNPVHVQAEGVNPTKPQSARDTMTARGMTAEEAQSLDRFNRAITYARSEQVGDGDGFLESLVMDGVLPAMEEVARTTIQRGYIDVVEGAAYLASSAWSPEPLLQIDLNGILATMSEAAGGMTEQEFLQARTDAIENWTSARTIGAVGGEVLSTFAPTTLAGRLFTGGVKMLGNAYNVGRGTMLGIPLAGGTGKIAKTLADSYGKSSKFAQNIARGMATSGASYGALAMLRDYVDPETGEVRDDAERVLHGLKEWAMWLPNEIAMYAGTRLGQMALKTKRATQQQIARWGDKKGMLSQRPGEIADDVLRQVNNAWVASGQAAKALPKTLSEKVLFETAQGVADAAGMSALDSQFLSQVAGKIMAGDYEGALEQATTQMAGTALGLLMLKAGSYQRIPDWQRMEGNMRENFDAVTGGLERLGWRQDGKGNLRMDGEPSPIRIDGDIVSVPRKLAKKLGVRSGRHEGEEAANVLDEIEMRTLENHIEARRVLPGHEAETSGMHYTRAPIPGKSAKVLARRFGKTQAKDFLDPTSEWKEIDAPPREREVPDPEDHQMGKDLRILADGVEEALGKDTADALRAAGRLLMERRSDGDPAVDNFINLLRSGVFGQALNQAGGERGRARAVLKESLSVAAGTIAPEHVARALYPQEQPRGQQARQEDTLQQERDVAAPPGAPAERGGAQRDVGPAEPGQRPDAAGAEGLLGERAPGAEAPVGPDEGQAQLRGTERDREMIARMDEAARDRQRRRSVEMEEQRAAEPEMGPFGVPLTQKHFPRPDKPPTIEERVLERLIGEVMGPPGLAESPRVSPTPEAQMAQEGGAAFEQPRLPLEPQPERRVAERRSSELPDPLEDPRFAELPDTVRQQILAADTADARKAIFSEHSKERRTAERRAEEQEVQRAVTEQATRESIEGPEAGQIDADVLLAPIVVPGRVVRTTAKAGTEALNIYARNWSSPLVDNVARLGSDTAREISQDAKKVISRSKEMMGQASTELTEYLKRTSGRLRNFRDRAALAELREVEFDGDSGFSTFHRAADGEGVELSERAQEIVDSQQRLLYQTGKWFENAGAMIRVPARKRLVDVGEIAGRQVKVLRDPKDYGGITAEGNIAAGEGYEWAPFTADRERKRFLRMPTQHLYDLRKGTPVYDKLVAELSRLNGIDLKDTALEMDAMLERGVFRRRAAEVARVFERFPDILKFEGKEIPLLEADPYSNVEQMVRTHAMRAAYIERFGQDIEQPDTNRLVRDLSKEHGELGGTMGQNLFRALNGMPLETPVFEVGSGLWTMGRYLTSLGNLWRGAKLTKAFLPNMPEVLGQPAELFGNRRIAMEWMRTAGLFARDAATLGKRQEFIEDLAELGVITRDVPAMRVRRGRGVEDVAAMASTIMTSPMRWVTEFNEIVTARSAIRMLKDLEAGRGTNRDRTTLEVMGLTKAEVDTLMEGRASAELNRRVARRAVSFAMGGTTAMPAEKSRLALSRRFTSLFAFQDYFMARYNNLDNIVRNTADAVRKGEARRAALYGNRLIRYFTQAAVAGTGAWALRALWGGYFSDALREAQEEPDDFLMDAVIYNVIGGVGGSVLRSATDGSKDVLETFAQSIVPLEALKTIVDMTTGQGPWQGASFFKDPLQAVALLGRELPAIGKDLERGILGIEALALSGRDQQLDRALGSYYRWRFNNAPFKQITAGQSTEEQRTFRDRMRKVRDLIKAGKGEDDAELREALTTALSGKTKREIKDVGASIRNLRVFSGADWQSLTPEQKEKVRRFIGEAGVRRLEAYDAILTRMAGSRFLKRLYRELPAETRRELRQQEREEKQEERAERRRRRQRQ